MSFGEHLEELRRSLGKALIWLGVGLAIGLIFANSVVQFVQDPLREAIITFEAERTLARYGYDPEADVTKYMRKFLIDHQLVVEQVLVVPVEAEELSEAGSAEAGSAEAGSADDGPDDGAADAPGEAVSEPTARVDSAQEAAPEEAETPAEGTRAEPDTAETPPDGADAEAAASPLLADLDAEQLQSLIPDLDRFRPQFQLRPSKAGLNSHKTEEGFMIWIKAGLLVGAVLASPMIFYHIWSFVAAGLYSHERKYVYVYLPFSVVLFASGVCLAFFLVLHYVLNFLLTFNAGMEVDFQPRLSYYMNFVLLLPLGFGIAFQLPLVMFFLQRIGIFETQAYIDSWRIAVLVICILSMILTPADITSMIALAIPLCLLYGLGILMCKYIPRGRGLGSQALDPV